MNRYPFREAYHAVEAAAYNYVVSIMDEINVGFELDFMTIAEVICMTTVDMSKLTGTVYRNWLRMPVANKDSTTSAVSRVVSIVRRQDDHHFSGFNVFVKLLNPVEKSTEWVRLSIAKNNGTATFTVDLADYLARCFES